MEEAVDRFVGWSVPLHTIKSKSTPAVANQSGNSNCTTKKTGEKIMQELKKVNIYNNLAAWIL